MPDPPLLVVGGSLAALVAADAAASRGRAVRLLLPARGVGGSFAPLVVRGRRLALGMRLLELGYEGAAYSSPPLADYRPGPSGHRAFVGRVAALVDELVGPRLVVAERPLAFVDGRLGQDPYLTVDLSGLPALVGPRAAAAVAFEAGVARAALGDAGLLAPERAATLAGASLAEASRANHGETFHSLMIEPFCRKLHPMGADLVPAELRRKLWMPLFHPSTLADAAAGRPLSFQPRRPMHTIDPEGPGAIVDGLVTRLRRAPTARLESSAPLASLAPASDGGILLGFADGTTVAAHAPVLGASAPELFAAAGADFRPERLAMVIAWVEAREQDLRAAPSAVHVPDPCVPALRISVAGAEAGSDARVVSVELRHDLPAAQAPAAARDALERTGLLREGAPLTPLHTFAGPAMPAPTAAERERFAAARERLAERAPRAEVVGPASAFGADALNEQVVQGLAAEEATR